MICETMKGAKAKLNHLVQLAEEGESVVLMRGSRHVAAIIPISDSDLELNMSISDEKAERFWQGIESEDLKVLHDLKDILQ